MNTRAFQNFLQVLRHNHLRCKCAFLLLHIIFNILSRPLTLIVLCIMSDCFLIKLIKNNLRRNNRLIGGQSGQVLHITLVIFWQNLSATMRDLLGSNFGFDFGNKSARLKLFLGLFLPLLFNFFFINFSFH